MTTEIVEMNIETVAENLRNTIAGKEMLSAHYLEIARNQGNALGNINAIISGFVQDNVDELKRILADVEQCIGVEEVVEAEE